MTDLGVTESADTIYAEATMAGAAGVAIVRVSGPASREILVGLGGCKRRTSLRKKKKAKKRERGRRKKKGRKTGSGLVDLK